MTTLLLMILLITMASCGQKQQIAADEDGNMLHYTMAEIPEAGFYVHDKKADTFSPVLSGFTGYNGLPNTGGMSTMEEALLKDESHVRSMWIGDAAFDPLKLIPVVDNRRTELVMFQSTEDDMPENYVVEKYKKLGYTIGIGVNFGETGSSLYLDTKNICEKTNAEEVMRGVGPEDGLLKISRINKSKSLPVENVDKEVDMLLGLEKDKKYQIGYFDGTKYQETDIIADTLAFKAQQVIELASPFKTTEDNYFVINLPENIKSGYYYINDSGMFGFKAKDETKYTQEIYEEITDEKPDSED